MQSGGPVIIYRIMYDDGEEVTAPAHILLKSCTHSLMHGTSSRASGTHRGRTGAGGPAHAPWMHAPWTCSHEGSVR
jgi:hypothetical protein